MKKINKFEKTVCEWFREPFGNSSSDATKLDIWLRGYNKKIERLENELKKKKKGSIRYYKLENNIHELRDERREMEESGKILKSSKNKPDGGFLQVVKARLAEHLEDYQGKKRLKVSYALKELEKRGIFFTPLEKIWIEYYFSFPHSRKRILPDTPLPEQVLDIVNDARMAGFSYSLDEVLGSNTTEVVFPNSTTLDYLSKQIREKTKKSLSNDDIRTVIFSRALAECRRQYYSDFLLEMVNITANSSPKEALRFAIKNDAMLCMYSIRSEPKNPFKEDFKRIVKADDVHHSKIKKENAALRKKVETTTNQAVKSWQQLLQSLGIPEDIISNESTKLSKEFVKWARYPSDIRHEAYLRYTREFLQKNGLKEHIKLLETSYKMVKRQK